MFVAIIAALSGVLNLNSIIARLHQTRVAAVDPEREKVFWHLPEQHAREKKPKPEITTAPKAFFGGSKEKSIHLRLLLK